ncbi:unnamed protein product [Orchesella dallaii]|uniref:C2H2-type domain-containing protein n=1 Tax=Orchesella dallaii TaxID=48710 RepID=A0ABP1QV53_9HEXA
MVDQKNCILCGDCIHDGDETVRISSFSLPSKLCLLSKHLNADAQFLEESTWDVGECIDNDAFCSSCSITVEAFIELHDVLKTINKRIENKRKVILRKLMDLDLSSFSSKDEINRRKLIRVWNQFQNKLLRTRSGVSRKPMPRSVALLKNSKRWGIRSEDADNSNENSNSRTNSRRIGRKVPGRSKNSDAKIKHVGETSGSNAGLQNCFVLLKRVHLDDFQLSHENEDALPPMPTKTKRRSTRMMNQRLEALEPILTEVKEENESLSEIDEAGEIEDSNPWDDEYIPSDFAENESDLQGSELKIHQKTVENGVTTIIVSAPPPPVRRKRLKSVSVTEKKMKRKQNMSTSASTSNATFDCFFCKEIFLTKRARGNHVSKVHPGKSSERPCVICGALVSTSRKMKDHLWRHKSQEEKEAEIAAGGKNPLVKLSRRKSKLNSGAKSLEREIVNCKTCGKPITSTKLKSHMWTHMSIHEKAMAGQSSLVKRETFRRCNVCGKQCRNADIYSHMKSHIPIQLRQNFECTVCGVKLSSETALKWHTIRKHKPLSEKQHHLLQCPYCSRTFYKFNRTQYNRHVKNHTDGGVRTFVCEQCGKAFKSKTDLIRHYITHNDERPHQCQYCPMAYRHRKNLSRHLNTRHNDEKCADTTLTSDPLQ